MLYNPPTGSTDPNAPYVGKNVPLGQRGSKVPPKAVEMPQREIVNAEVEAGLSPTNDDPKQLLRSVRGGKLTTFDDQSTLANVITITPVTAHNDLHRALPFRVFPAFANTQADVTVQVNAVGALSTKLKRRDGTPLAPGDVVAGVPLDVVSDGTNFRVMGFVPSDIANLVASAATAAGYVQIGDQSYGAQVADRVIATNAAFTVPRSITLPSAAARLAGDTLVFMDRVGAVSGFNPLTFAATGTDTLDGQASFALGSPYQMVTFRSDGAGRWTYERRTSTAFRAVGDADVTLLPTDGTVSTNVPLTASRTWTLPAANAVRPGTPLVLADIAGSCSATTAVTVAAKGADTLNGQPSIALSTAFFQAMAISDGNSRWGILVLDPKQFQTVTASLADGGVAISVKDATHVQVLPKNGGSIYVNGVLQQIGSAGLTIGNSLPDGTGLLPNTKYNLFLGATAGAQTLRWDTAGHAPDAAGRDVKVGDASLRFLATVLTNASGQFQDTPGFRGLRPWFNRPTMQIDTGTPVGITVPFGSSSPQTNTLAISATFICFADDFVRLNSVLQYTQSGAGTALPVATALIDGQPVGYGQAVTGVNATNPNPSMLPYGAALTEGVHTLGITVTTTWTGSPTSLTYYPELIGTVAR